MKIIFDFKYDTLDYRMKVIIFQRDDEFYYLSDISDRYLDVMNMPYYIRDDYFKYKSEVLTLEKFNDLLSKYEVSLTGRKTNIADDELEKILQIRRDLKLKDIIHIKNDLLDIFNICKNEIKLSNNDTLYIRLYTKIMGDCLLEYYGLTNGEVNFIDKTKETLSFSKDEREAKLQYRNLTNPKNDFSAYMLKMVNDYKNTEMIEEFLKLVTWKLTGEITWSEYYLNRILNKRI